MSKRTIKESAADSSVKVISCVKKKDPMKETINVAAYCRVSKDIEEQQTSLDNQMASFERIIVEHRAFFCAEIFSAFPVEDCQHALPSNVVNNPELLKDMFLLLVL